MARRPAFRVYTKTYRAETLGAYIDLAKMRPYCTPGIVVALKFARFVRAVFNAKIDSLVHFFADFSIRIHFLSALIVSNVSAPRVNARRDCRLATGRAPPNFVYSNNAPVAFGNLIAAVFEPHTLDFLISCGAQCS